MESKIIISSDNIKPSSPTPRTLKTYKISMLDQIMEPALMPIVLYFPPRTDNISDESFISGTTEQLKHSLSIMITRFYPFAGRINEDRQSIDCTDDGVHFVVAKFPGHRVPDLLRNPCKDLSDHLLPDGVEMDHQSRVLLIQVNYFDCLGIVIGARFWHGASDAATMVNFLKAWASANRGSTEAVCPNYISQFLFPHKDELLSGRFSLAGLLKTGKWATRRYVFDSLAISFLQVKSGLENPTKVEAVTTLLWKCFMIASLENGKSASAVTHAVNLRWRARPPFPADCFGNFFGLAAASSRNQRGGEYGELGRKLRDALRKVDDDYVTRLQGDDGVLGNRENTKSLFSQLPDGVDILSISSWCRFDIYSIDFGWGKPVWMTAYDNAGSDLETSRYINFVWLMDTRIGDGVEAWVTLGQEYMEVFDAIEELRDLACIEPTPLLGWELNNN